MKTLDEEAEEYYRMFETLPVIRYNAFIAGAQSDWVKAENIKAQIEVLTPFVKTISMRDNSFSKLCRKLSELEQQLKQLEYGD